MEEFVVTMVNDLHSICSKKNLSIKKTETNRKEFDSVIDYIIENVADKNLSVKLIASVFGLSPSNFSHQFKRHTGQAFIDYLAEIRMERAKSLLCNTDANLSDIVDTIGFGQVNSFIRRFRRETGITPIEYRRRNSSQPSE